MKLNDINTQALAEENQAWEKMLLQIIKLPISILLLRIILIVLLLSFGLVLFSIFGLLVALLGVPALTIVLIVLIALTIKRKSIWERFAADNNWQYLSDDDKEKLYSYYPACMPGIPIYDYYEHIVRGNVEDYECMIMSDGLYYMVIGIKLPRIMPHIILESMQSGIGIQPRDTIESAELEGSFTEYFKLYHHKNDQINALSIITPDIMQVLVEKNQDQNIEIIDDKLFFLSAYQNNSKLRELLGSVIALGEEITHKAENIHYHSNTSKSHIEALYEISYAEYETYAKNHTQKRILSRFFILYLILCLVIVLVIVGLARRYPNL
jgi:hypothetical protein